jgi:hypothetical protein
MAAFSINATIAGVEKTCREPLPMARALVLSSDCVDASPISPTRIKCDIVLSSLL